jgi:integrase
MPTVHLTQRNLSAMRAPHPDGKRTIYWSDELRGFGVACSGKTNQRLYIAQRDVNGRARRVTIGAVGEITLAMARERAKNTLDDLRRGIDPKKKERVYTLRQALDEYLGPRDRSHEHPTLRPASVRLYWQLERLLAPWLDRRLGEITVDMIERRHRELAKEIGTSTANLAMRVFRIVWNFAADRSTLPDCPVSKLRKRWYEKARRTRHVAPAQLPAFYAATRTLRNEVVRDYLTLLLLTGLRKTEAANLRWDWVDLAAGIIRLPAQVTKGKRALDLPMSTHVRDLLVRRRTAGDSGPHVFPGRGRVTAAGKALREVAAATGILVSPHDLRRTFASVAADTPDVSWLAIKLLLNHTTQGDVTAGYVQISTEQLRAHAQRVTDRMLALCGAEPVEHDNVKRLAW